MKSLVEVHANINKDRACWRWRRGHTTGGRPEVWYGKRVWYVYRLLYENEVAPIPKGLTLDHVVCNNGWCCNPAHCEPVTNAENVRRQLAQRYAERTACPKGHPYEQFRRRDSTGKSWCTECNRIRLNALKAARSDPSTPRTRCPRNHSYAEHGGYEGEKQYCKRCRAYWKVQDAKKRQK